MKRIKILLLTSLVTLFTTFVNAVPVNMAPITSYLLSDTQQVSLSGTTKFFLNTLGGVGFRNYASDGSYTGSLTQSDGTTLTLGGIYSISDDTVILSRTSPAVATVILTYLGEKSGGLEFDVAFNAGEVFQSISFASEEERDIYQSEFLATLLEGKTKYFANTLGGMGSRTYAADGSYTGSFTPSNSPSYDISGTYSIVDYVMTLNRTSPAEATLVLTYTGEAEGIEFDISVNGGEVFKSISFATEMQKVIYISDFLANLTIGQTEYFTTTTGLIGSRTYGYGSYTGSITDIKSGTTYSISGTNSYSIPTYVMILNRTSPSAENFVFTYIGTELNGLVFSVLANGVDVFQSVSFRTEAERDNYLD